MMFKISAACLLLCACAGALAKPAPWHLWSSKYDGKLVCTQVSPGPGWQHYRGPYTDSHCEKLALVK